MKWSAVPPTDPSPQISASPSTPATVSPAPVSKPISPSFLSIPSSTLASTPPSSDAREHELQAGIALACEQERIGEQICALLTGDSSGVEHVNGLLPQQTFVVQRGVKARGVDTAIPAENLLRWHPDRSQRIIGGEAGGEDDVAGVIERAEDHPHRIGHAALT